MLQLAPLGHMQGPPLPINLLP